MGAAAASSAKRMLASEAQGLAIDFTDTKAASGSAIVKDTGTPGNNFDGAPEDLLTQTGSDKWVRNSSGLYALNPAGTLHVDHDKDGNRLGLLVEGQATNLVLHSNDASQSNWSKIRCVIGSDATVAPDGSSACKISSDNGGGAASCYINQNVTVANSTEYTASAFFKKGTLNRVLFYLIGFTSPANTGVYFNLSTGLVDSVIGSGAADISSEISDVGNGWFRCSITFTTDASDAVGTVYLYLANDSNNVVVRDGTKNIYMWGTQLETGSKASSPIPTEASTVTRSADSYSLATSAFPYSATASSMLVEFSSKGNSGETLTLMQATAQAVYLGRLTASITTLVYNGSPQLFADHGSLTLDQTYVIRAALAANDFATSFDGGASIADSSGSMPNPATDLYIGRHTSSVMNGHIKRLAYVPRRVSDGDLPTWIG